MTEVYCLSLVETALGGIPRVTYPLDDNFERVRSIERGEFTGYGDKEEHRLEAQRFMSSGNYIDALDLVFDCMCVLLDISRHMEKQISTKSQVTKLTEDDILEAEVVRDGISRKYKRNSQGKLEQMED